ncbi:MAG TPA: 6-carboxytetrahydropterin synthase QueD [Porticoccaceae bacterium]|nr:6-carboxytetrahydropterin synthase QueD [Porticoccaceae bacterium]HCO60843.1 6-carboxytetrahydropterin synthase QueD [Porticoccaceae bacterium]
MEIFKSFTFEAAHMLPHVADNHKCKRLHGHSFHVTVYVSGPVKDRSGWVMDFGDIKQACEPIYQALDHRYLNDIPGLENPTSEHIARWIWVKLLPDLPMLNKVEVRETCTSGCVYQGE